MIVRDEEQDLPRCLRSVAAVAREIVVVDTGSHDRTPHLAREAGARVLDFPWTDDFSAARNFALSAATSEWVLSLDADEELMAESVPALQRALLRPEQAQLVHIHLLGGPQGPAPVPQGPPALSVLRLFRNDPRIRFHGRVHENVAESLLAFGAGDWPDSGVQLRHHGYLDPAERRRKAERNLLLLEAAHRDDPLDLYVAYKLALTLPETEGSRRRDLLARAAQEVLDMPDEELCTYSFLPQIFYRLSTELRRVGELSTAGRVCAQGAERLGKTVWFTAGKALAHAGQHEEADAALLRYLETEGPASRRADLVVRGDPEATMARAWHLLGWTALMTGRYEDAMRWLDQALVAVPAEGASREGRDGRDVREHRDQHAAIACDWVRTQLRTGHLDVAVPTLSRLAGLAEIAGDSRARREVMLLSAEVSVLAGDLPGALPLARAAIERGPGPAEVPDDRGAAMCATLLMRFGQQRWREAEDLLPLLPGTRYDTLAVRLLVLELCGSQDLSVDVPAAALSVLEELHKGLPL